MADCDRLCGGIASLLPVVVGQGHHVGSGHFVDAPEDSCELAIRSGRYEGSLTKKLGGVTAFKIDDLLWSCMARSGGPVSPAVLMKDRW